jgi:hypothetical protein
MLSYRKTKNKQTNKISRVMYMNLAYNGCQHAMFFLFLMPLFCYFNISFFLNSACAGGLRRYIYILLALGWVSYMSQGRCSLRSIKVMTYDHDATAR